MAQPTYRSFIGVAPDTVNGYLSSSVASGGTSLVLTNVNGTPGSTYSAIIVDGPNTETVTVSSYTGSTATVAATTHAHSAGCYVYFQVTSTIGPLAYIPVTKIDFHDDYTQLYDEGFRGSMAKHFGAQQGMRIGAVSIDGDLFADTFGYLLSSLNGSYDYTASNTTSTSTTYAFSPKNTSGSTGQPTNYLFYDFNPGAGSSNNMRVFAAAALTDLTVKFDPAALVTYSATIMTFASGIVANPSTVPPNSFTSFTPLPSRYGSVSLGGTTSQLVESAEFVWKREEATAINTLQGIQDPLDIFVGPLTLTGKFTMVMNDETQLSNYINESQPSVTLTALRGATVAIDGLTIQVTKANYEQVKVIQGGKAYVELEVPFTALANSTDASTAGGGLSPSKVTLSVKGNTGSTQY